MALIDNLVAYWDFDEASGNATDVENGHVLVETSGTIASTTGKISNARDFEAGDTEYFTITDANFTDFPTSAATFSIWCKPESVSGDMTVFEKAVHGGGGGAIGVTCDSAGKLRVYLNPPQTSYGVYADVSSFFAADTWVHLVIVFDGAETGNNRLKIYKNGSLTSPSYNGSMPASLYDSADAFNVGIYASFGWYWDGLLDEFGIWSDAKTSTDVTDLYGLGNGLAYPFTPPAPDIGITDQTDSKVWQRVAGGTTRTLTFSGTYATADPATIEVKLVEAGTSTQVQDWTALSSATIGSGTWTGSLSVPQHDTWLNFIARSKNGGGTVMATSDQSVNVFGVGVVVLTIGQSNMERMFTVSSSPPTVNGLTRRFDGGWGAVIGNGAIRFADQLQQSLDVPIGVLDYAVDASGLLSAGGGGLWSSESGGTPLTLSRSGLTSAGGDCEYILWHQGENDAVGAITKANYKTEMDTLYSRFRTDTGRSTSQLKFGCAILSKNTDGAGPDDAETDAIRQAHLEWATETTGAFIAGSSADRPIAGGESYHWAAADYEIMGRRYAQAIAFQAGQVAFGADGPAIASAYWEVGTTDLHVIIAHDGGNALEELDGTTDGGSITGFEVSADAFSSNLTISSTAISGDEVVLTMSANRNVAATIVLRYQYGQDPIVTNPVYDNTNVQGGTLGLPLLPSLGNVTVSETAPVAPVRRIITQAVRRAAFY